MCPTLHSAQRPECTLETAPFEVHASPDCRYWPVGLTHARLLRLTLSSALVPGTTYASLYARACALAGAAAGGAGAAGGGCVPGPAGLGGGEEGVASWTLRPLGDGDQGRRVPRLESALLQLRVRGGCHAALSTPPAPTPLPPARPVIRHAPLTAPSTRVVCCR